MKRQRFDLLSFPLRGLRLIEASAGTGKTFSLAGLYLRLLVVQRLDVRDILVMTFTRAATQELRERIRIRLAEAARLAADPAAAVAGDTEHEQIMGVIDQGLHHEPREHLVRRLRDAAARMDEATISTIHAFAQQAAQENAFDSGLPFDRGAQVDDRIVQDEAIADYWRSQVIGQGPEPAAAFLQLWPHPDQLAKALRPALEKPHLHIVGPGAADILALAARARSLWPTDAPALEALLQQALAGDALLKNKPLHDALLAAGGAEALLHQLAVGLAGTVAGFPSLPGWLRDLGSDAGTAGHVKKKYLGSCRPQDLALVQTLATLAPVAPVAALRTALGAVRSAIRNRKQARRQFSFADMIEALHAALTEPTRGPALADALHRNWPYALVDEFQDTDPQQYEILRRTYRGRETGALIMIGDPKQAIYGFRGGDVYAYLQAAHDADGCYELDTNYRSTPAVLRGIETLFHGAAHTTQLGEFLVPAIRFHQVQAGRAAGDRVVIHRGQPLPAITAWTLADTSQKAAAGKQDLLDATVAEICALLDPQGGARIREGGSDQPVVPSDIAVLVNTNAEAADVQRALALRGIAAVCLQRASVFETEEARHLLYVLRAMENAARPEAVRAALTTPLFGYRSAALLALDASEAGWLQVLARFQDAHETWRSRGVLALLEPLLQAAAPTVLALHDGERRMTNYLQLADLLAGAETETFGRAGLIRWFTGQIRTPGEAADGESRLLRLESDDALVRIVTVHRVKGLQYRIVFVPFAPWLGAKAADAPWNYHDQSGRACLDLTGIDRDAPRTAALEARAESLRLLYVALTRAEQACYFGWGAVRPAQNSALAWLLHADAIDAPQALSRGNANLPEWLDFASARARLVEWAARAHGAVRVVAPPAPLASNYRAAVGPAPTGAARSDLPTRRPDWSVFSFSRLVAGGRQQLPARGADDEAPDPLPESEPLRTADPAGIALRGPVFGTAMHQLLEAVDPLDWPTPAAVAEPRHLTLVERQLRSAGIPLGEGTSRAELLHAVAGLVSRTLHTPLPGIGPLAAVPSTRRLVEMEFYLALGGERLERVLGWLNGYGYGGGLAPERRAATLDGLMQGFVDLTVEADGRFWIIDYKTNDLGAHPHGYRAAALQRAVHHGHYDLQYLIYLVALHRHLQRSLPGYDPARHLGGAQYLFLRGLNGTDATTGVFVDRPPAEFIIALSGLFGGAPTR